MLRRSWVEINLCTLVNNYKLFRLQLPETIEIMAVVKADAYGHGEVRIATVLQQAGCNNFAVSNIKEAVDLRNAGITGQILVLGYTPSVEYDTLLKYDITQTLLSDEYAQKMPQVKVKAQFAIDTGMNRIGLNAKDLDSCICSINKYRQKFNLTGVFTHLCVADNEEEIDFTIDQIEAFKSVCNKLNSMNLSYIHCMNSAGTLYQKPFGNLARLGIVLYGLKPDYVSKLPEGIKPILEWKSVVSMIKRINPGDTIGYGRTYVATKPMMIATIPTGYADGYNRKLSNIGHVIIHGEKAPIVGRICMDQMMVDITDIPSVKFEDEVILMGAEYNADDMAHDIGSIGYEVLCNISKRVPRKYI